MIKKDYFPVQEVPSRVKDRTMKKIYGRTKTFRLFSLITHEFMAPALALLLFILWWYLYLQLPKQKIIVSTNSGGTTTISTSTVVQTNTVVTTTNVVANSSDDDYLLQQKLAQAELALHNLSNYANQEENITL